MTSFDAIGADLEGFLWILSNTELWSQPHLTARELKQSYIFRVSGELLKLGIVCKLDTDSTTTAFQG